MTTFLFPFSTKHPPPFPTKVVSVVWGVEGEGIFQHLTPRQISYQCPHPGRLWRGRWWSRPGRPWRKSASTSLPPPPTHRQSHAAQYWVLYMAKLPAPTNNQTHASRTHLYRLHHLKGQSHEIFWVLLWQISIDQDQERSRSWFLKFLVAPPILY